MTNSIDLAAFLGSNFFNSICRKSGTWQISVLFFLRFKRELVYILVAATRFPAASHVRCKNENKTCENVVKNDGVDFCEMSIFGAPYGFQK